MNRDIFALVGTSFCAASVATAAGAGDATKVSGACIDVLNYDNMKLVITYSASLTADKTLDFTVEYQQVETLAALETAVALLTSEVVATGAGTKTGTLELDIPLTDKKRYFAVNVTPNLSHSGTDTVKWAATYVLGGADTQPIGASVI